MFYNFEWLQKESTDIWTGRAEISHPGVVSGCEHGLEAAKSEFVERFLELSLFYRLSSPLDSEMICIFPYFCPCEESAREIREILFKHCSLLYQEVLRNPV